MHSTKDGEVIKCSFAARVAIDAGSAVFAEIIAYPFLSIWTVQQSHNNGKTCSFSQACLLIRKGSGFYSGFSLSLLAAIPGTLLFLIGKDIPLYLLGNNHFGQIMQGPVAQAFGMIAWTPASRLMMLQQACNAGVLNKFNQMSLFNKGKSIWKEDGIRGFYRGALPSFCVSSLLDSIGFWLQAQTIKSYSEEKRNHPTPQVLTTMGSFAIAAIITTPLDVVVTRIKIAESNPLYFRDKKFFSAAQTIGRKLGWGGFFTGMPVSMCHDAAWSSVLPLEKIGMEYVRW